MEATIYNRHTSFNKRGKPAIMRIDAHNGNARIQLSVEAVKLLELQEGDCLSFVTLPTDKEAVYFCVDNKDGFHLKVCTEHKSGVDMGIFCRQLARKLLDHLGINSMRSFIVTTEKVPVQLNGKTVKMFFIDKHKTYSGKFKPNSKIS